MVIFWKLIKGVDIMICNKCGKEISNGSKFCNSCGNKLKCKGRWKKIIRLIFEIIMIIIIALQFIAIYGLNRDWDELLDSTDGMLEDLDYSSSSTQDFYLGYWYDESHNNKVLIKELNENTITFDLELYRESPITITANLEGKKSISFNAGETAPELIKNQYGVLTLEQGLVVITFWQNEDMVLGFYCNNKKEIPKPFKITDTSGINGRYHNVEIAGQDNYVPMTIEIQDNKVRYSMTNCVYTGKYLTAGNSIIIQYDKQYIGDDIMGTTPDLNSETFTVGDNKLVQTHKNDYYIEYTQIYVKEQ